MEDTEIDPSEFCHKTLEKLMEARWTHRNLEHGIAHPDLGHEYIGELKILFQDYLERLQRFDDTIILPKQYGPDFVEEAYERSCFDWGDREAFEAYLNWFHSYMRGDQG